MLMCVHVCVAAATSTIWESLEGQWSRLHSGRRLLRTAALEWCRSWTRSALLTRECGAFWRCVGCVVVEGRECASVCRCMLLG